MGCVSRRPYRAGPYSATASSNGTERVGHPETTLVDRPPDDDAAQGATARSQPRQGADVVERAHTTARDHRDRRRREHRGELTERGSLQGAVAADLGDDQGGEADFVEASRQIDEIGTRAVGPAADRDRVAAGVEPDRDTTRVLQAELLHQGRSLDRGGADDHPFDARVEQLHRSIDRTHAPAHLDAAGNRAHDVADLVEVRAFAGPRGVEVDDVDPARPGRGELARDADRVVVVDGLGLEITLVQTHAVASAQVDGREQLHAHEGFRDRAQSVPLVDGTPAPSTRTASRRARATPLNDASMMW